MNASYYLTLFRRELWQHKGAIIVAPIVLLGLVQVGALFSSYLILTEVDTLAMIEINGAAKNVESHLNSFMNESGKHFQPNYAFVSFAIIICIFYMLDSLYSDRKDRSVLFWRSMPVSEYENVIVKLLTSMLVIPILFFVVGLVSTLLASIFLYLSVSIAGLELENTGRIILYVSGLGSAFKLFLTVILLSTMLLPVHLFLLTISSFARKSPWLTLILPILGISILESMIFRDLKLLAMIDNYIESAAITAYAMVNGGEFGFNLVKIVVALGLSAGFYFTCVTLRLRRFEI